MEIEILIFFIILFAIYMGIIISKQMNEVYSDNRLIFLDNDISYIIEDINKYKGNVYDYDDKKSRFMSKVLNTKISEKSLILADNFDGYDVDELYNLRNYIGINGYIAVVENKEQHDLIESKVKFSNKKIFDKVIDCDLLESLKKTISDTIEKRWQEVIKVGAYKLDILNKKKHSIEEVEGKKVVKILDNSPKDSFVYIENELPSTILKQTSEGQRINLLCSDKEFKTLIHRIENL
jgi:transposase-like protein